MTNKKIGLIILDGLGYTTEKHGNAFLAANTPNIDKLIQEYPHSILQASELAVGLPQGQMGNSEVGHLNIGAGRIVKSELVRINEGIETNTFTSNKNLIKAIELTKEKNKTFHIIGLASKGGVHSQLAHILEVIKLCGEMNVNTIVHAISDGRDCDTHAFINDLKIIMETINRCPSVKLGSIGGRYYGMDRNTNWDRNELHLNALLGKGKSFKDPHQYVLDSYSNNITDEFIVPAYNEGLGQPMLKDEDTVFVANFRPDRARQISHLFKQAKLYNHESKVWNLKLTLVTMVKYDGIDSDIIIYPPERIQNTLGKVLETNNLKQLRLAETEKYAHVTFFFDGGVEYKFNNEDKILIPSPSVATYDLKPEMSAYQIADTFVKEANKYDVVICNFANCDMVGHTGNWDATIKAVEAVDKCVGQLLAYAKEIGMTLFITADHGNCDTMIDKDNKPITTHSLNPVLFISTDKSLKLQDGSLGNISPTILKYLGIDAPSEMNLKPLF